MLLFKNKYLFAIGASHFCQSTGSTPQTPRWGRGAAPKPPAH